MIDFNSGLPRHIVFLGISGLLPQILVLGLTLGEADRFTGLAAGYFYAALIFSFLGGLWWGVAISNGNAPKWVFGAAVMPSLIAFATGVPWMTGAPWPGPSLAVLGLMLFASVLVDWRLQTLKLISREFLGLRVILSAGLGLLTLILALRA
jgi:Protein of unknown function (DUF3429)